MKIEIRGFKEAKFASEETMCFEATVVVDGKPMGRVSNDGQGGAHRYSTRELRDTLTAYAATLPPIPSDWGGGPLQPDADLVISDLTYEVALRRDMTRLLGSRVVILKADGRLVETKRLPKGEIVAAARTLSLVPENEKVLNLLPEEEAFRVWKTIHKVA